MATITGTTGNDILTVQADTTSVQAGSGADIVIFSGNYADYTFSQSDSYVPLITNNNTAQVVSLFEVEQLQFDDGLASLSITGSGEFLVNTYTAGAQSSSSTTALADGGFVITWMSNDQDGSSWGIYAQRYDASGNNVGDEFQVNTYTSSEQRDPSATALADGGFVITWMSNDQDGSSWGIYAQRYDASGNSIADEFLVNASSSDESQRDPSVAALNDGGFVITWSYENKGIYAQRYDAAGNVSEVEFRVNTDTTYYDSIYTEAHSPSVGALNDGGYIIAWDTGHNGGYSIAKGVYAQRYDANSETVGNEFKLGIDDEGASTSISALSNDGFVISWRSGDSVHGNVISQIYNSNGDFVNEYLATDESMMIDEVSVSHLNNGDFVTAWAGGDNIYIRYYDVSGNATGEQTLLTNDEAFSRDGVSVTSLNDGGFVVAWNSQFLVRESDGGYHYDYFINSQRFDSESNKLGIAILNEVIPNTAPTGEVTITGDTYNTEILTATNNLDDANGITDTITYTWSNGKTGATITLDSNDVDQTITVTASYTDDDGNEETVTSEPTGIVTVDNTNNAQIYTTDSMLLDNLSLLYFKDGIDTGASTLVEQGGIKIDTSIDFDSIRLSIDVAYQGDINIMDMYDALNNIGQIIDTSAEHAADTNNDGTIDIMDMYSVLTSIGQTPQSFDLIDETGNLVTSLNTNSVDIANWTIIANGDVDQSGGFGDAYVMQVDIV